MYKRWKIEAVNHNGPYTLCFFGETPDDSNQYKDIAPNSTPVEAPPKTLADLQDAIKELKTHRSNMKNFLFNNVQRCISPRMPPRVIKHIEATIEDEINALNELLYAYELKIDAINELLSGG